MCPVTGLSYKEPAPHNFSFNSPQGACPRCKGLGYVNLIDVDKVIPDRNLSIYEGAIAPLGKYKNAMIFWQIEALLEKYDFTIKTPVKDMPEDAIDEILYGSDERIKIKSSLIHTSSDYFVTYEGDCEVHPDDAGERCVGHCPEVGGTVCQDRCLPRMQGRASEQGGVAFPYP